MNGSTSGILEARKWRRVVYQFGTLQVLKYAIFISSTRNGAYRCYTAPVPFPVASGTLTARQNTQVTLTVLGYGDIWIYSPDQCEYALYPVGP